MARVITIINQKGGVGKTTTADSIGSGLRLRGYRVLFIDLDAQANLSYGLEADASGVTPNSSLEVLTKSIKAQDAIQRTERGDIIAGSPALSGADLSIVATGKEYRLKEALEPLQDDYDYIIIDTPPVLGIRTINALTASNGVIIPSQADIYSLVGITKLNETIEAVQQYTNPDLTIMGIVITMFNPRTIAGREVAEVMEETAQQLNTKVYDAKIRESVAMREAQIMKKDIFSYDANNNVAKDYNSLIDEILEEDNHE